MTVPVTARTKCMHTDRLVFSAQREGATVGNLGNYQLMTALAKKFGGPVTLLVTTLGAGYVIGRTTEASAKRGVGALKNAVKQRNAPCELKDTVFTVRSDGTDGQGLEFKAGAEYRVLECKDNAILIELIGDDDNPHVVFDAFLATISDFPAAPAVDER